MLILKDISIAELALAYASKTTPTATLTSTNGKDHEEPVQIDVFSLSRHGNGEDLVEISFDYWGPKKTHRDLRPPQPPRTIRVQSERKDCQRASHMTMLRVSIPPCVKAHGGFYYVVVV